MDIDLLNQPPPPEWARTRHCPSCGGVDLMISSVDPQTGEWCFTSCKDCGRELRRDYIDGRPTWEDPEWISATEQ